MVVRLREKEASSPLKFVSNFNFPSWNRYRLGSIFVYVHSFLNPNVEQLPNQLFRLIQPILASEPRTVAAIRVKHICI